SRENRFYFAQLGSEFELAPFQSGQIKFLDVPQSKLAPDLRRRVRNDRMRERRHNPQSFSARVKNGCKPRPAFFVLLLSQGPWLVLDNVLVYRRHQTPCGFQCTRELELIKQ